MVNNVVLMGRLVASPELKNTQSGISVTSFNLAVEREYAPQGEKRKTDFFSCVAWKGTAEFISKYFQKGSMIAITGSLQNRSFEDKNGNKRTVTEVLINQASFCGGKKSEEDSVNNSFTPHNYDDFEEIIDDDCPF